MTPNSRYELYLQAILSGDTSNLPKPITREEIYLYAIAMNGGGGGGGGTTNYNSLQNKPRINNTELSGNKTSTQLGLQSKLTFDATPTDGSNNPVTSNGVYDALLLKVATITLNGVQHTPLNGDVALTVIDNTVNNLINYYKKTETYTKQEVDDIIGALSHVSFEIVASLPTSDISTSTIYLVLVSGSTNNYMQYMYINNAWAELGSTEVDLTNYYTKTQVDTLLDAKQDTLTFDNSPTNGSNNPVKSGGIYTALAGKEDTLTWDSTPTQDSTNPVTSGGVYTAINTAVDSVTANHAPSWTGTVAQWEALTAEQKAQYDGGIITITDI